MQFASVLWSFLSTGIKTKYDIDEEVLGQGKFAKVKMATSKKDGQVSPERGTSGTPCCWADTRSCVAEICRQDNPQEKLHIRPGWSFLHLKGALMCMCAGSAGIGADHHAQSRPPE
eukprot:2587055-Rhodomonas_salina.1